jgi:hypothetical protein
LIQTLQELCRVQGCYGAVFNLYWESRDHEAQDPSSEEYQKAAPWWNFKMGHEGTLLFNSQEEAERIYAQTKCDDFTDQNAYNGPAKCYLALYGPDGKFIKENT